MKINTEHFKELLTNECTTLETELAKIGRKNPDVKGDWEATENSSGDDISDEFDVADKMEEYENNRGILTQLETRLAEVKKALAKIDDGSYGICEVGGEEIEEDRLEANPSATTCKLHM